jgi:hypothetical protein
MKVIKTIINTDEYPENVYIIVNESNYAIKFKNKKTREIKFYFESISEILNLIDKSIKTDVKVSEYNNIIYPLIENIDIKKLSKIQDKIKDKTIETIDKLIIFNFEDVKIKDIFYNTRDSTVYELKKRSNIFERNNGSRSSFRVNLIGIINGRTSQNNEKYPVKTFFKTNNRHNILTKCKYLAIDFLKRRSIVTYENLNFNECKKILIEKDISLICECELCKEKTNQKNKE